MNEINKLDALIDSIGDWILQGEMQPGVLNPIRLRQIQFSHAVIKLLTNDIDAKVTYTIHQPFKGMGSICVEGESLEFSNCKWLGRAIEFASNVEVYSLSNGKVRFVLTFHGLTRGINIE